jgi:hypothetical protein
MALRLAAGLFGLGSSAASAALLDWSAPMLVDSQLPFSHPSPLSGVSCPSERFRVAVSPADGS